ncbi:MAG: hypothetical protein LBQ66_12800 [Planctomycetaceae bacterium]|nr:hypothetical protein [Planctomycetaceae bacterium]
MKLVGLLVRFPVCFFWAICIFYFCSSFGLIFCQAAFAQNDSNVQKLTPPQRYRVPVSSQQYDAVDGHPLRIYSGANLQNQSDPSENISLDDAPTPSKPAPKKLNSAAKKTTPTKTNPNPNPKPNIKLAAAESVVDDYEAPTAPLPITNRTGKQYPNAPQNNNTSDDFENESSGNNDAPIEGRSVKSRTAYADQNNNTSQIDPFHPPIKTASFNGVTPGITTMNKVVELWGKPRQELREGGEFAQLFSLHELQHIEIAYDKNRVVKSIVIRFDELFPEHAVREQFEAELLRSRPVLIPDESGRIIGELFPEKGVVFLFSGAKSGGVFQVRQIGIESVISEPFVLRAEATMADQPTESYRDLTDAVRINDNDAKAYWLLAKINLLQGFNESAILNIQKAVQHDDRKPAYHLVFAQILGRMNRVPEAIQYLEETLALCERFPHEKARVHCALGDFYRNGQKPDCETAYRHHAAAIEIAKELMEHANPTIRQTAKDILFEARLSAARDVAWGHWKGKERAVDNWIASARLIANDSEMIAARRFSAEYQLRLSICELACQVAMATANDVEPYVKEVIQTSDKLLSQTNDPILVRKLKWETGLAIYDAVQIYQLRERYLHALKYGELAADYMEAGVRRRANDTDLYLLGRLYFRLGTIHALGNKNHRAAIEWFDKAKPVFERLLPKINPEELGRLGESFVSMGVSYWLTNQRGEAVKLTEMGLRQIERGVKLGFTKESAFAIPYSNLQNMYNELGDPEKAKQYQNLSSSIKLYENKQ